MQKTTLANLEDGLIYNRTSCDEQRQEGYSIEYQERTNKEYALKNRINPAKIYNCSESAKEPGRKIFNEMLNFAKKHKNIKHIIFKKCDRSARNELDAGMIIHLARTTDLNFHFTEDRLILNKDSRPYEYNIYMLNCSIASMYPRDLSVNVKNGLKQKADEGHFPSVAPFGYENVRIGKRSYIEPKEEEALVVKRIFELYNTGLYSYESLAKKLRQEGYRKSAATPIVKSTVEYILNNPVYMGDFIFKGEYKTGKHKAIVSKETFNLTQKIIQGHNTPKCSKHLFLFSGIAQCEVCGCAYVGEKKIKKYKNGTQKEYLYYRCTGNKGGNCKKNKKYIQEQTIEDGFLDILNRIKIPKEYQKIIKDTIAYEMQEADASIEEKIKYLNKRISELKTKTKKLLMMRLQDEIDADTFKEQNTEWQNELSNCIENLESLQKDNQEIFSISETVLELAENASEWYLSQSLDKKRQIIKIVCSNLFIKDKKPHYELHSIFQHMLDFTQNYKISG